MESNKNKKWRFILKKKLSILVALVMAISLCLVPAAVQAADPVYPTVGSCPTDITIDLVGDSVMWTIDIDMALAPIGNGHIGYGLVISLDGVHPAFQIHGNDGTDANYAWGTHLYSAYVDGWHTGDTNTPVSDLGWVEATGERYIVDGHYDDDHMSVDSAGNPDGIFTIAIDKANLAPEFYWAVAVMANTSDTHYPDAWAMWSGDASGFETVTLPGAATDLSATVPVPPEHVIGISVDQTAIGFGSINPGDSSAARTVTVTNTGNIAEDFSASLTNISSTDVYTDGLAICEFGEPTGPIVSVWKKLGVASQDSVDQDLILTVPTGTPAGTYKATIIFWAVASP